jgi:hypothetical protein
MGSHNTLDQQQLAAEARPLDPDHWSHGQAAAHLAADYPQVHTWPDDNPDLTHDLVRRERIDDHAHPGREVEAERAFDRLNPDFGVPADRSDRIGHRDLAQREHALSLGVRVAIHDSRQNDPNPHVWQPSQDYRAAEAIQAARHQPTRWGPERTGPER